MGVDLYGKCPYATAQKAISGKWSILIMHLLEDGPVRFNELLRNLPDMTNATLSKQLKRLEANGLIVRKEYPQLPPKVEYSLSPMGERFRPVLKAIEIWGYEYMDYVACCSGDGSET